MGRFVILAVSIIGAAEAACELFPNGTDTAFHWWQCNDGPIIYYDAKTYDETGTKTEYPIHMSKPVVVRCEVVNPTTVYGSPNLRLDIRIWSWRHEEGNCGWSPVPTLGFLSNLDACKHGIKCPVALGRQNMDVVIDFTKIRSVVHLLTDDAPYQMQYELLDRVTGDRSCFMGQARARTQ